MDALLPALCLVIGIILPVAFLYLVVHRGWRQLAIAEAYRTVSSQLGLQIDTRGVSLHGLLDDRRIYIGELLKGHGTERKLEYRAILTLERPLGLGLYLHRRTGRRWFGRKGIEPVTLGDVVFDKQVELFGDDVTRIRRLIDGEVADAVLSALAKWPDLELTDHLIRIKLKRPHASAEQLSQLVHALRHLANALATARENVHPPLELAALIAPWTALGERLELTLDPWHPALHGTVGAYRILIAPRREEHGYTCEIRLWFQEHRAVGLRISPQLAPDGYWSVGQDIQLGDSAFDSSFVIKGYNPDAVRTLLSDEVRSCLTHLAASGTLDVDDRLLQLRDLPLDASKLEEVIAQSQRAAAALGW